jgi:hypothetical protein
MEAWTPKQMADAQRTAVAMALAGWRNDPEGVAVLWNGATNKEALIWALSRLPSTLIRGVSAREGRTLDPEEVLAGLLEQYPDIFDPEEN